MAHINFLEPQRFAFRQFNLKNLELNYFSMMIILAVVVTFMISFGMVQRYRVKAMDKVLSDIVAEAKKAAGATTPQAGAAKATMKDALAQRVAWSPILNAIANHTPDTIALNFIKGAATGIRSVQLEGSGADVLATVRYEEELSTLPVFSKVFLKSSTGRDSGEGAVAAAKPDAAADKKKEAAPGSKPARGGRGASQPTFEIQAWLK